MPDRQTPLAERILARTTGSTRAAAIYGDLLELSTTRTRLWFWLAYTRTLLTLTWRTPVALIVGAACFVISRQLIEGLVHLSLTLVPPAWRVIGPVPLFNADQWLTAAAAVLWFILPYSIVRYSLRNQFAQITLAICLGATIASLYMPWLSVFSGWLSVFVMGAAFFSVTWRRAAFILIGTFLTAVAAATVLSYGVALLTSYYYADIRQQVHYRTSSSIFWIFAAPGILLVTDAVCTRLHRRLLEPRPSGAAHA